MDRVERSEEKIKALFGDIDQSAAATDPDFFAIQNRFIFGEVACQGKLPDRMRELITLVVLTTSQTLEPVADPVRAALHTGVSPVEIKEAIYQCTPYIGFPRTLNALSCLNEVIPENK